MGRFGPGFLIHHLPVHDAPEPAIIQPRNEFDKVPQIFRIHLFSSVLWCATFILPEYFIGNIISIHEYRDYLTDFLIIITVIAITVVFVFSIRDYTKRTSTRLLE